MKCFCFFLLFFSGIVYGQDDFPTYEPTQVPIQSKPFRSKGSLVPSSKTSLEKARLFFQGKKIALLIGVSQYQNSFWNQLKYPAKDVKKMKKLLSEVGNFDRIFVLDTEEQTTRKSILAFFSGLQKQVTSSQDSLFVYFSGHGTIAQSSSLHPLERYWVLSDSTQDIVKTGLSVNWVKAYLEKLSARQKGLLLATCYVGSTKKGNVKALFSGVKGTYAMGEQSSTSLVLSAAGFMQPAYEVKALQGDVYTHFFAQCGTQAFQQKQPKTFWDLHQCATPKTYQYVKKILGRNQTPMIESKVTGKDQFYLFAPEVSKRSPFLSSQPKKKTWIHVFGKKITRLWFSEKGSKSPSQKIQIPNGFTVSFQFRMPLGSFFLQAQLTTGEWIRGWVQVPDSQPKKLQIKNQAWELEGWEEPPEEKENKEDLQLSSSFPRGGGFLDLKSEMVSSSLFWGLGVGLWWLPATLGVHFELGQSLDSEKGLFLRFGFPLQFGYTFAVRSFDFFPYVHLELGGQTTQNQEKDLVFVFAYGLGLRFRWFFKKNVSFHLNVAAQFLVSNDRETGTMNEFNERVYDWNHSFQLAFALGISWEWSPAKGQNIESF